MHALLQFLGQQAIDQTLAFDAYLTFEQVETEVRAKDPALAHIIRVTQSVARLIHRAKDRVTARLRGACVGSGIEMPAAAGRVIARRHSFFRLPEVSMGLIPGAGGTVTIPRRIGRHRAAYMAISGADIDVDTALAWGLIDGVET